MRSWPQTLRHWVRHTSRPWIARGTCTGSCLAGSAQTRARRNGHGRAHQTCRSTVLDVHPLRAQACYSLHTVEATTRLLGMHRARVVHVARGSATECCSAGRAGSAEEEGVSGCMQQLRSALWDLAPRPPQPQLPAAAGQDAAAPGSPGGQPAGGDAAQAGGAHLAPAPGVQAGAPAAAAADNSARAAAGTAAEHCGGEAGMAEAQPEHSVQCAGRSTAALACQLLGAAAPGACLQRSA